MLIKTTLAFDGQSSPPANFAPVAARRKLLRALLGLFVSSIVLFSDAQRELRAEPQTADIVGLGATTCQQLGEDTRSDPITRRDYLAWAQGFMSGILLSRPPGVDVGLNLNPPTFDILRQLQFLEDYCAQNGSQNFADAVKALYKRLRKEGRT